MRTVVIMDFGGEMWKNEFTGVTISGRCFAIEEIDSYTASKANLEQQISDIEDRLTELSLCIN